MKRDIGVSFMIVGLCALLAGMFFGCLGAFQYLLPGAITNIIPFYKIRPLHVSLVISWIFLASIGGIYYYLPNKLNTPLYSPRMAVVHLWIFVITGIIILLSFLGGVFGGREYWEFHPLLSIPIFISWMLFGVNYFKTVFRSIGKWPVYYWMWGIGIVFFFISFLESYLWTIPFFRDNLLRDITIQWKANGAIVGSWNMLVYGTAIFLMEKIGGNEKLSHSNLTFALFFLGLTNLMFGWSHHLYLVPNAAWIRHVGYAISMTELIVLAKLIWDWRKSIVSHANMSEFLPFRFLIAADFWIIINLVLAILISIPAINIYTHGTHITVAHAMGSTIGINTMILLASVTFLISEIENGTTTTSQHKWIRRGFIIANVSLLPFLLSLIISGVVKGYLMVEEKQTFREASDAISPFIMIFAVSGLGVFFGFAAVILPSIKLLYNRNSI